MTAATPSAVLTDHDRGAAGDLSGFGYGQELHRSIGTYASFAAGFSFVSILTTVFQLFGFGFSFGGPVFFWTWPACFVGQFLVALCFAELAGALPDLRRDLPVVARASAATSFGWFAGWIMIIAQIVTVAAAAIALQVVLPAIWCGFQIVGGDPALDPAAARPTRSLLGVHPAGR